MLIVGALLLKYTNVLVGLMPKPGRKVFGSKVVGLRVLKLEYGVDWEDDVKVG